MSDSESEDTETDNEVKHKYIVKSSDDLISMYINIKRKYDLLKKKERILNQNILIYWCVLMFFLIDAIFHYLYLEVNPTF